MHGQQNVKKWYNITINTTNTLHNTVFWTTHKVIQLTAATRQGTTFISVINQLDAQNFVHQVGLITEMHGQQNVKKWYNIFQVKKHVTYM